MPKPARPQIRRARRSHYSESFTVGRDRFAQISAVEGIALTTDMREMMSRFDREGLSAEERRRAIIDRFALRR